MKRGFFAVPAIIFALETAAAVWFACRGAENTQDVVAVNEAAQSVCADWHNIAEHVNRTDLDYVVTDSGGSVVFRTKTGLSESINAAVSHRDTVLDIGEDGAVLGKIIVYNDSAGVIQGDRNALVMIFVIAAAVQLAVCAGYALYLYRAVVKPFRGLEGFAERVAGGDLDIPLEMDRGNLFGAFTESFDIMRAELKKARIAEARANTSKKELVAKLSHDIRTPVASIKAVSELGAALAADEKARDNFNQINMKADQINVLVGNLFSATLEELQQLTVSPSDMESGELRGMLTSSDYFGRANIPEAPARMIYADKLRLQQVFDNIFANSYKYADTEIDVKIFDQNNFLAVEIEDHGGGVSEEELPSLKEKFRRGKNAASVDGAGLGLYISDCFMREMGGGLLIENGSHGLKITVFIPLSGTI